MNQHTLLVTALAAVAVTAGCLGGTSFSSLAAIDGTYHIAYEASSSQITLQVNTTQTEDWERKLFHASQSGRSQTLVRYRHRATGTMFYCSAPPSQISDQVCQITAHSAKTFPAYLTDLNALEDDLNQINATKTGEGTVQGRKCTWFRFNYTASQLLDQYNMTQETYNTNQFAANACIDNSAGFIAEASITSPSRSEALNLTATSIDTDPAPINPSLPIITDLDCARDTTLHLLPLVSGQEATYRVSGQEHTVQLEQYTAEQITLGSDINTVTVQFNGETYTASCRTGLL